MGKNVKPIVNGKVCVYGEGGGGCRARWRWFSLPGINKVVEGGYLYGYIKVRKPQCQRRQQGIFAWSLAQCLSVVLGVKMLI